MRVAIIVYIFRAMQCPKTDLVSLGPTVATGRFCLWANNMARNSNLDVGSLQRPLKPKLSCLVWRCLFNRPSFLTAPASARHGLPRLISLSPQLSSQGSQFLVSISTWAIIDTAPYTPLSTSAWSRILRYLDSKACLVCSSQKDTPLAVNLIFLLNRQKVAASRLCRCCFHHAKGKGSNYCERGTRLCRLCPHPVNPSRYVPNKKDLSYIQYRRRLIAPEW